MEDKFTSLIQYVVKNKFNTETAKLDNNRNILSIRFINLKKNIFNKLVTTKCKEELKLVNSFGSIDLNEDGNISLELKESNSIHDEKVSVAVNNFYL